MMAAALTLHAPRRHRPRPLPLRHVHRHARAGRRGRRSPYDGYSPHTRWQRISAGRRLGRRVPPRTSRARHASAPATRPSASTCIEGMVEDTIPADRARARSPCCASTPTGTSRPSTSSSSSTRGSPSGGVLIIDDYGHYEGARRAVDEYFAETGERRAPQPHRLHRPGRDQAPASDGRPGGMSGRPRDAASSLSVVAPVLNEEEVLEDLLRARLRRARGHRVRARPGRRRLHRLARRSSSTELAERDPRVRVVAPLPQLRLPGRGQRRHRPRPRRRGGHDRRRPPGPARADRRADRAMARRRRRRLRRSPRARRARAG